MKDAKEYQFIGVKRPCCCEYGEPGDEDPSEPCSGCSDHCDYDTRPVCDEHLDEAWAWRLL